MSRDVELVKIILSDVQYKDWTLLVRDDNGRTYLQWSFFAKCAKTGVECEQLSRKWHLSPHMTVSELVCTAFKAALTAEEHECRENFRWKERRIFNPHIDVKVLWLAANHEDMRS